MQRSLKLFTLYRIPVHLHWTFGIVFIYALYVGYANQMDLTGTLGVLFFFLSLFSCVLLHEFGHSLTALRFGVPTQDIILTPIGGIARMRSVPEKPLEEFLVAIAGPAVNVVIAGLLFFAGLLMFQEGDSEVFTWIVRQLAREYLGLGFGLSNSEAAQFSGNFELSDSWFIYFFSLLLVSNIGLVLFNLIPAFPMDGGRIFRSLLAMRYGKVRATRTASIVGQVIAVIFVGIGIFYGPISLALIGIFVFSMAKAENNMVQMEDLLRNGAARQIMKTNFSRLADNDWMQIPIDLLKSGAERNFLVYDLNGHLAGKLREHAILSAGKKRDLSAAVREYMDDRVAGVSADDSLQSVYILLMQAGAGIIAVLENGEIVGVIEESDLSRLLASTGKFSFRKKMSNQVA